MKCPFCSHINDKVVDSRESKEGESIRRRRECIHCEKRFTTYERIDEIPYMVIKKDGRREKFDRQKVLNGLLRACEKQTVQHFLPVEFFPPAIFLDDHVGNFVNPLVGGKAFLAMYALPPAADGLALLALARIHYFV